MDLRLTFPAPGKEGERERAQGKTAHSAAVCRLPVLAPPSARGHSQVSVSRAEGRCPSEGLGTNAVIHVKQTPGTVSDRRCCSPCLIQSVSSRSEAARSPHPSQRWLMPSGGCWTGREGEQWAWVRRIWAHHPLPNTGFRTEKRLCS